MATYSLNLVELAAIAELPITDPPCGAARSVGHYIDVCARPAGHEGDHMIATHLAFLVRAAAGEDFPWLMPTADHEGGVVDD